MKKNPTFNDMLSLITNDLVGSFELSELLNKTVKMVMRFLNAEVCSIFLDDKQNDSDAITMRAGSGFAESLVGKARYKAGEGLTGYIYQTGKKFNIKSPEELQCLQEKNTDEGIWVGKHDKEQWSEIGYYSFRNLLGLPLKIKEEIIGVIKVENKRVLTSAFSVKDERIFEIIANVVSLAIENVRLWERLDKQSRAVSAKAAHRIGNKAADYDAIEYELGIELDKGFCSNDKIRELKQRISETTVSLKSMTSEFKRFGKPLQIDKGYYYLNKIIDDEVWLAQRYITNIRVTKDLDEHIPELFIDGARFAEAIKELIRNAVKAINYSERKNTGKIKVTTKYNNSAGTVTIKIEDNGTGFPKDFPIFEPFSSTDPEGTGLGLCTVRELVERHGGEICKYDLETDYVTGIMIVLEGR